MFASLKTIEVGLVLAVIAAAALFFHMWENQVKASAALQESNLQLQQAAKDKAAAVKSRSTIEQKNRSVDYPALIDKLKH